MSILDGILKQVGGSPDTIGELAGKVGVDPAMVEKGLAALGQSQPEDGDTVDLAAKKTGIDTSVLGSIMSQMGGESAVGEMAKKAQASGGAGGIMSMLDQDGDGNPINDITKMASGFFGKK